MTPARFGAVAAMLDATARYCVLGRSRFSSANNHLVGELAGLAAVTLLVPGCRTLRAGTARPRRTARRGRPADPGRRCRSGTGCGVPDLHRRAARRRRRPGGRPRRLGAGPPGGGGGAGCGLPAGDGHPRAPDRRRRRGVRAAVGRRAGAYRRAHLDLVAAVTDGPAPAGTATTPAREWFAAMLDGSRRPRPAVTSTIRGAYGSTWHPDGGLVVLRARAGGSRSTSGRWGISRSPRTATPTPWP